MDVRVIEVELKRLTQIGLTKEQSLDLIRADMQAKAIKELASAIEWHSRKTR